MKWEVITSLNVAYLYHWSVIILKRNLREHWDLRTLCGTCVPCVALVWRFHRGRNRAVPFAAIHEHQLPLPHCCEIDDRKSAALHPQLPKSFICWAVTSCVNACDVRGAVTLCVNACDVPRARFLPWQKFWTLAKKEQTRQLCWKNAVSELHVALQCLLGILLVGHPSRRLSPSSSGVAKEQCEDLSLV
jgi:hypothetical protein